MECPLFCGASFFGMCVHRLVGSPCHRQAVVWTSINLWQKDHLSCTFDVPYGCSAQWEALKPLHLVCFKHLSTQYTCEIDQSSFSKVVALTNLQIPREHLDCLLYIEPKQLNKWQDMILPKQIQAMKTTQTIDDNNSQTPKTDTITKRKQKWNIDIAYLSLSPSLPSPQKRATEHKSKTRQINGNNPKQTKWKINHHNWKEKD